MFHHSSVLKPGTTTTFVSVNATNTYVATASIDGNISIRSMSQFDNLYKDAQFSKEQVINRTTTETTKYTLPTNEVSKTPIFSETLIDAVQIPVNTVGVRSRSKITSMRYANLESNANLLGAVYKNGEVYIIANPQDVQKCRIQQIFKHVNGLLLDFAWSSDDQLLAFSSVQNEVIIYDIIYGKIITTLYLHKNTIVKGTKADGDASEELPTQIKGITFDKLGSNYLYTMADDKVLNIIKYELVRDDVLGRRFEYKIVQEYENIIHSAKLNKASIKKLTLSPDDKVLAVPNTLKSKSTKISILNNDPILNKWKISTEFLASGFKSIMLAFSPCIYQTSQGKYFYLLASSSNDSTLSIWRTDSHTPVYVCYDALPGVQDFSWSIDGSKLFMTLQNAQLSCVVFDAAQFGKPVYGINELSAPLLRRTNSSLPLEFENMTKWRIFLKDHPLQVEQRTKEMQEIENSKLRKITIRGKTDKKDDVTASASATPSASASASVKETPKITTTSSENTDSSRPLAIAPKPKTSDALSVKELSNTTVVEKKDQKVSKLNEKVDDKPEKTEEQQQQPKEDKPKPVAKETVKKRPLPTSNYDLPSVSVPKDISAKVAKIAKKDSSSTPNASNVQTPVTKKKRENEPIEFVGSVIINPQISFSNIRIAVPKVRTNTTFKLPDSESIHLQVKNGNGLESQPTKISLIKEISKLETKQLFVDFIPHRVHIVCGSTKYIAISTINGHIMTYSESGNRILPPIVLGSPLSFLEMKDNYLLAVTSTGEVFVWNLEEKKSMFKPISLYPLLHPLYSSGQASSTTVSTNGNETVESNVNIESNSLVFLNGDILTKSENLTICSITSQGVPIVTLSNGNGYLFNKDMNTWSLISDSWWAFGSQYWDSTLSIDNMKDVGLLELLESHTNEEINRKGKAKFFTKVSKMMLMREGFENLETIISLNHLENKINFYLMLNDYVNYKNFLILYTKRLSELNLKNRLLEILRKLFMDIDGKVCGHSKKDMLEELILSCSKYREVQHILVQFSESIGLLKIEDDSDFEIL